MKILFNSNNSKISLFNNFFKIFKFNDKDYSKTFFLIASLFLLWGFSMGLIDVLNKHFQEYLHLSKTESGFIQSFYYMGYFLMALPAGYIARNFGYKKGIVLGLFLVAIGSIIVPVANAFLSFLICLFIIAAGFSALETVANPYTTLLGAREFSAARINLAQSCNAIGQILGPFIGGRIILSATKNIASNDHTVVYIPYIGIAIIVILLMVIFWNVHIPEFSIMNNNEQHNGIKEPPLFHNWHFNFAIVAQLLYLIAQTGICSFFINYVVNDLECSSREASVYLSIGGFGLFFVGRIIGSFILRQLKPYKVLTIFAILNSLLMLYVMFSKLVLGSIALICSFFFMSIMFPTIFALGIYGINKHLEKASSFIVMTLIGGAFTPIMGYVADITNIKFAFVIPLCCFTVISLYGLLWKKLIRGQS